MKKNYKWIRNFLISICVVFVSITIFNYYTDSFNLFKNSNGNMAQDLHNGYYITGDNISVNRVNNIYEPLISNMKNNIDVLAIGSSRTMILHKSILFGEAKLNYYNFTDGTARLRHYAKIFGLLNKYNTVFPHTVILGLDPWIFDEKASLAQIKNLLNKNKSKKNNYSQLINYEYTKLNILSLINQKKYLKSKKLQDLKNSKNVTISPNGEMYYPFYKGAASLDKLLQNVEKNLKECDKNNSNTKCIKYSKLNNFTEVEYLLNYFPIQVLQFVLRFHHMI